MSKVCVFFSSGFFAFTAVSVLVAQSLPVCAASYTVPSNLNLSSTNKSVIEPKSLPAVQVLSGGKTLNISGGSTVTPAVAVAIQQILTTGRQSIVVGSLGNATGGLLVLPPNQSSLSSITVPHGLTLIRDFASSNLTLSGNLNNGGNFYAVSTSQSTTKATIVAADLINGTGALLTTVLPTAGLAGFGNAAGKLDLALFAKNITNSGTISSSGNLSLTGTGANLLVQNSGGTLQAANNINISTPNAASNNWLNLLGGELLSQQINLAAAAGKLNVSVDQASGLVNASACSASIGAFQGGLNLGVMNIKGDPTFWSPNSISIDSTFTATPFASAVTILSGGDITFNATAAAVNLSSSGNNITLVAGANLVATSGAQQFAVGNPNSNIVSPATVTVKGPGAGGSIQCNPCTNGFSIDASSNTGNGGNILLAAYSVGGQGGTIDLTGGSLSSGDSLSTNATAIGTPGNITIIGKTIKLSGFTAVGTSGSATVSVTTAQPAGTLVAQANGSFKPTLSAGPINPAGTITVLSAATLQANTDTVSLSAGSNGTITMNSNSLIDVSGIVSSMNGGTINLNAGNITASTLTASGFSQTGAGSSGNAGGNSGSIKINASGVLSFDTGVTISTQGGTGDSGINPVNNILAGGTGGKGGAGGAIVIQAGTADLSTTVALNTEGGSGGNGVNGANAGATGAGGAGGAAGAGGNAGAVTITTTTGNLTLGEILANGGNNPGVAGGASAGAGGQGSSPATGVGGAGGVGGTGSNGGKGGAITITSAGTLTVGADIISSGGTGILGGSGGPGGDSQTGGVGGAGGNGGAAGAAAPISMTAQGDITYSAGIGVFANGGIGNSQGTANMPETGSAGTGGSGGSGGTGSVAAGGAGGNGGAGGLSAPAGSITISSVTGGQLINGAFDADFSAQGAAAGNGGAGQVGGQGVSVGGKGGNGGSATAGGAGAAMNISANNGTISSFDNATQTFFNNAYFWWENDGSNGGTGGAGGGGGVATGAKSTAGAGGNGGNGGNGGIDGNFTLSAASVQAAINAPDQANYGNGGNGGAGGDGGGIVAGGSTTATNDSGGTGGTGGTGGNGAPGGPSKITVTGNMQMSEMGGSGINIYGGTGGTGGAGGTGGNSSTSQGNGGTGGNAGIGGNGATNGTISLTVKGSFEDGDSTNGSSFIFAGGDTGGNGGGGGNGGIGFNNGGSGGTGSKAGSGGAASPVSISVAGSLLVDTGGDSFNNTGGYGGTGGSGGNGGNGGIGSTGLPGSGGPGNGGNGGASGDGASGGAGSTLTISATNGINFGAGIAIYLIGGGGGASGTGGTGGNSTVSGNGGNGGNTATGGNGAASGNLKIISSNGSVNFADGCVVSVTGGAGTINTAAGPGGTAVSGNGGAGGIGGAGGSGGSAGTTTISANLNLVIDSTTGFGFSGGAGAAGSPGGNGGQVSSGGSANGGAGAAGGNGGTGGAAGILSLSSTNGSIILDADQATGSLSLTQFGGSGGAAGNGGSGGNDLSTTKGNGGNGANSGNGGAAGAGGTINLTANAGSINFNNTTISQSGGVGGNNALGGSGGSGFSLGGNAGNSGKGGAGGAGGTQTVTALSDILINSDNVVGSNGGSALAIGASFGTNLAGGNATITANGTAGNGGSAGAAGVGGNGGSLTITSTNGSVIPVVSVGADQLETVAGNGGNINGANGGQGGNASGATPLGGTGGNGGNGPIGANGGNGRNIKVTAANGIYGDATASAITSTFFSTGGSGSDFQSNGIVGGGTGGTGGFTGGNGGSAGSGGNGGNAGTVTISAAGIFLGAGNANGGDTSPSYQFNGGTGGQQLGTASVGQGGLGGAGGSTGNGGNGAAISLTATTGIFSVAVAGATLGITANGGSAPIFNAGSSGGTGGASPILGGKGATGGSGGNGGTAGSVTINAPLGTVNVATVVISANGGNGAGGSTGGGGATLSTQNAQSGNGGNGGTAGAGGNAGTVTIKALTVQVAHGLTTAIGGSGGTGGAGAAGGTNNFVGAVNGGGNGGNGAALGGKGGNGGTITFPGFPSTLTPTDVIGGLGGAGGTGGAAGTPGGSSGTDNSGRNAANGSPGKITIDDDGQSDDPFDKRKRPQQRIVDTETPETGNQLEPVAFVQQVLKLSQKELAASNVLLTPSNRDASARAGMASIRVSKGCVAFVVNNGRSLSVLSLHDTKAGDVSIQVGPDRINLRAGEQVIITSEGDETISDANPLPEIAVRRVKECKLQGGARAFTCEFSLPSALLSLNALSSLKQSAQGQDRALYGRLLKNAVVLQVVTATRGSYK